MMRTLDRPAGEEERAHNDRFAMNLFNYLIDGRRLPLNNRQRLQFNGTLIIDPVDKSSDAGLYTCEARGQNGLTARQSLQLGIIGESN